MNSRASNGAPKRILVVLYSFELGGSQIVGLELARQFARSGAEVLCAAIENAPGPLQEKCAAYRIPIVDLNIPRNIFERNGLSFALTRRLAKLQFDALHLHHFLSLNKLGIPARLAGIKRILVTEHSVLDVSQSLAGRMRARFSWRLASAVTAVHESIKQYLCTVIGVPPARVFVLPIGVELGDAQRRHSGPDSGSPIKFVFVGRLAAVKDVPGLIAAFLAVQARQLPEAGLVIVGDGEDRAACQKLINSHPLGNRVTMVGAQIDPRPHLAAADVFVLNSRSEGTPRALLEAMAQGLPGIGPAIGGIPDMLQDRGWLTIPGEPSSLEAALQSVLENPHLISVLGDRCFEYVKSNFDPERIADRYLELLTG